MSELYFNLGSSEGFTSSKLADKRVGFATPIRELLQNSLDAVREIKEVTCEINIYIETIPINKVPHKKEYEAVLKKAIQTMKDKESYNKNSQQVVEVIQKTLKKNQIQVLILSDNGMGMPKKRLDALLEERSSKGGEASGGSFGVGHLSCYSLSLLRYVLYATQFKGDNGVEKLFSGSPILAGHIDDNVARGATGRIVAKKPKNEKNPEYDYRVEKFPDFMKKSLQDKTGTAVAILGLSESWDEKAEYAIASNFFHSIIHDGMNVKIHHHQPAGIVEIAETVEINDQRVEKLIEDRKDKVRVTKENILSGRDVWQALQAIKESQKEIELSNGDKVYIYIKTGQAIENSTIALIRNGMLIARHDKMLSQDINNLRKDSSYEPFTVVIDVDNSAAKELFTLVKGAEGPYHNELSKNRLEQENEKKLQKLFRELSEEIKPYLNKIAREEFGLPLFEIKSTSGDAVETSNNDFNKVAPKSKKATVKDELPQPNNHSEKGEKKSKKNKTPNISLRNLKAKTAFKYTKTAENNIKIAMSIRLTEPLNNDDSVYFSTYVEEDSDNNNRKHVEFIKVNIDGEAKEISEKTNNSVALGKLNQGKLYTLMAEIKNPANTDKMRISLMPVLRLKQDKKKNV